MQFVALDLETPLIGTVHGLLPPPITYSFAWRELGETKTWLLGNGDEGIEDFILRLLLNPDIIIVTLNGAFDFGVLRKHHPRLAEAIYRAYLDGRIVDCAVRDKLAAIATNGRVREDWDEDGEAITVGYGLADMVQRYFGQDRTAAKEAEDAVRMRYAEMDGLRADQYPAEFREYALQDAVDTLHVYLAQRDLDLHVATQELQVASVQGLTNMTAQGLEIDVEETERLERAVEAELVPEKLEKLLAEQILRPGHDGRPAKNGSQEHVEGCDHFGCDCSEIQPKRKGGVVIGWQRKHVKGCERPRCDCPPKMTKPEPPSIDTRKLHERVLTLCSTKGIEVQLSDKGQEVLGGVESLPSAVWDTDYRLRAENGKPLFVSVAGDFLHELAAHDPVLFEYRHRKRLDKLRQFLGKLREAIDYGYPRVHPGYDLLKETGRTSSYGNRKGVELGSLKAPLPALNVQQVPNPPKVSRAGLEFLDDLDVRYAFKPNTGYVYVNVDFSSLELVTTAQVTLDLFGFSRHAELLNGGRNCHTYLGAQVLYEAGDGRNKEVERFRGFRDVRSALRRGDRVYLHDAFLKYKTGTKAERKCFKRYRTTAKPLGLGFPGALGARKMAYGIFPQYNLTSTEAECRKFKALWLDSYPEMVQWFDHIQNTRRDPEHAGRYWYESWGGFRRVNCSYNAAANGEAMQTPGAMAAKMALALIDRATFDPSAGSILYGRFRPNLFVHDEIGGETPEDETAHFVATEVSQLMEQALRAVCPDVQGEAEPLLTRRWCKDAEPVFNEFGRLVPWEPED